MQRQVLTSKTKMKFSPQIMEKLLVLRFPFLLDLNLNKLILMIKDRDYNLSLCKMLQLNLRFITSISKLLEVLYHIFVWKFNIWRAAAQNENIYPVFVVLYSSLWWRKDNRLYTITSGVFLWNLNKINFWIQLQEVHYNIASHLIMYYLSFMSD